MPNTRGSIFSGFRQVLRKGTLNLRADHTGAVRHDHLSAPALGRLHSLGGTGAAGGAYVDSLQTYLLNLDTAVRKYAESKDPADLDPGLVCRPSPCPGAERLIALIGADEPRAAPLAPLAVFAIDLDDFKAVNDRYGHAAGDGVLRVSSARMRQLLRESDVIVRLGGDKFVIVLGQVDHAAAAREVARRVVECLRQPIPLENGHIARIGALVGIAMCDPDTDDTLGMPIKQADAALYAAKREGENTYREADTPLA